MRLRIIFILTLTWSYDSEEALLFTQFKTCDDPIIKVKVNFRTIGDSYQLLNVTYRSPIINGENLRANLTARILVGEIWMPLFALQEEKGVCALAQKYMGPFFDDLLRGAALMQSCPLPKGTYLWRNYRPMFQKLRLQLPSGTMNLKLIGTEIRTSKLAFCLDIIAIKT